MLHITGTADHFGIQALSRTCDTKLQDFQAPNPVSRVSRALKNGKKISELSRTFKEEWPP